MNVSYIYIFIYSSNLVLFSAEPGLDDEKRRTLNLLKNEDGEEKSEIPDINFIDSKKEQDER